MAEAHESWPSLISVPSPLADVSEWYLVSRYPDMDERAPSSEEIGEALGQIDLLIRAIEAQAPSPPETDAASGRE